MAQTTPCRDCVSSMPCMKKFDIPLPCPCHNHAVCCEFPHSYEICSHYYNCVNRMKDSIISYTSIIWVDSIEHFSMVGIYKLSINKQLIRHVNSHVIHFHVRLKMKKTKNYSILNFIGKKEKIINGWGLFIENQW